MQIRIYGYNNILSLGPLIAVSAKYSDSNPWRSVTTDDNGINYFSMLPPNGEYEQ